LKKLNKDSDMSQKWIIIMKILKKKHFDDNSKKIIKMKEKTIATTTANFQSYDNNIK